MKLYVLMYFMVGFGYFVGAGIPELINTRDRFRVAMGRREVFAMGMQIYFYCILIWPYLALSRKDWWKE